MLSAEVFAWESCLPLAWACASNEYGGIENDVGDLITMLRAYPNDDEIEIQVLRRTQVS